MNIIRSRRSNKPIKQEQPHQALSSPTYRLVTVSGNPVKYPHADLLGQIATYSASGLPAVGSSFLPQSISKPASGGTGVPTVQGGTQLQFGIGPLSAPYNNFLGTSWAGNYGTTVGSGTEVGLAGTIPATAGIANPTVGVVTKPEVSIGTGIEAGFPSRPPVNTIPPTVTGTVPSSQVSITGYNPQTVQGNLGSGCPSFVSVKPASTCLQVGPQPVSVLPGTNIVQSPIKIPDNQVTQGASLGSGNGVASGIVGGSGINGFIPPATLSSGSVGSYSGVNDPSVISLESSGTIAGIDATDFIPQTVLPLPTIGSQIGLNGSSLSNLGVSAGGTSGAISLVPQSTPLSGSQGGLLSGGTYGSSAVFPGNTHVTLLPTAAQSQPYSTPNNNVAGFQTIVCVTPELCSHLAPTTAIPADGVLCNPRGCRPVSLLVSEDYYAPELSRALQNQTDAKESVPGDSRTVSNSTVAANVTQT